MVVQFRIGLSLTPPTMGATFTCLEQRLDNITANGQQKVKLLRDKFGGQSLQRKVNFGFETLATTHALAYRQPHAIEIKHMGGSLLAPLPDRGDIRRRA